MQEKIYHTVPIQDEPSRFSDYAIGIFPGLETRNSVKKAIKEGDLTIDGDAATTGRWIHGGEKLVLQRVHRYHGKSYRLPLEILYSDDVCAVVWKPAGLIAKGNYFRTLEKALPYNLPPSSASDAISPMAVHRLDASTSGLLLVARSASAMRHLSAQFQERLIRKKYHALVMGLPSLENGIIETPVDDRDAVTHYTLLEKRRSLRNGWLSLLELSPHTGRTHQLRKHCAGEGFPILGDSLYGPQGSIMKGKGLFLSSTAVEFMHPVTEEIIHIESTVPGKFDTVFAREERLYVKFGEEREYTG